ncbi:hypothetical protein EPA93_01650 [Ktedonosporobacter rubrisoli]|uniref:Pyridoxamine 5'-phosphate oxidase family protein n=1 Tax=Ktedonosporobacter rubrisoli TaxID=2509675 RepID=A0A4P6JI84_KTERU|nr:pyridoxamine 5'-phosphate oxidase family protein [Ktedonosporobacter rubrisoli]QBD74764.1 hypothetical protein EPA93_01650 [Ktedonosporobacter rubrisoli]
MPYDALSHPYNAIRRRDRAVSDEEWIKQFLHSAPAGSLATVHEGQPFLNNNLFIYDEFQHVIYVHTGPVGRTRANIERDERVCFSVYEMGRLYPGQLASEFGVEYASVTIFGTATIIEDLQEKRRFFDTLFAKYFPDFQAGKDYQPSSDQEIARPCLYKIQIQQWSGKKHIERPDFPGAFRYEERKAQKSSQEPFDPGSADAS